MDKLIKVLKKAEGTGEILKVAYMGGSRPGAERDLVIIKCAETEFRAREEGVNTAKSYKINKIDYIIDSSGLKHKPDKSTTPEDIYSSINFPGSYTLKQFSKDISIILKNTEWEPKLKGEKFTITGIYKNGKSKNTPSISIQYIDHDLDVPDQYTNIAKIGIISIDEINEKQRNWRVDSWRWATARFYTDLKKALNIVIKEIRESDPVKANVITSDH